MKDTDFIQNLKHVRLCSFVFMNVRLCFIYVHACLFVFLIVCLPSLVHSPIRNVLNPSIRSGCFPSKSAT
ncbi:hypothetical protein HanPSC8_Chr09g0387991 [Helianthus annuus]|nr:hypothetical protein HanPSC8_Chr09g0387991 [Helianthus annuus]